MATETSDGPSPAEDSEEAAILRDMVKDRDQRMALIQKQSEEIQAKHSLLQTEWEQLKETVQQQKIQNQTDKTKLLHTQQSVVSKHEAVQRDLQQQSNALSNFAQVVAQQSSARNNALDPSDAKFVMRLQAQLCKAMHSMGILDHQLELLQTQSQELSKWTKERVAQQTEATAQVEQQLLNELMKTDNANREVEGVFKKQFDDICKEITNIQEQMDDSDSEEDDDDDDDEEEEEELDEEEQAAKEEAFKLLQSHKEQIEVLEIETEEQAETIEELREWSNDGSAAGGGGSARTTPTTPAAKKRPEEEKKEPEVDPNDILAVARARAAQAKSKQDSDEDDDEEEEEDDSDVEEIDNMDLLKMAQSRMRGEQPPPPPAADESEAADSEEEDETEGEADETEGDAEETEGDAEETEGAAEVTKGDAEETEGDENPTSASES